LREFFQVLSRIIQGALIVAMIFASFNYVVLPIIKVFKHSSKEQ
jgi:hypothetical protein